MKILIKRPSGKFAFKSEYKLVQSNGSTKFYEGDFLEMNISVYDLLSELKEVGLDSIYISEDRYRESISIMAMDFDVAPDNILYIKNIFMSRIFDFIIHKDEFNIDGELIKITMKIIADYECLSDDQKHYISQIAKGD